MVQQPIETVLVQARASGRTVASDPELRQAVRQVAAALAALPKTAIDVRSPFTAGGHGMISRDGRSALVTFTVAGKPDNADQTVGAAERAVAAVQARHPGLLVGEAGQASVDRATNSTISADFRRAEVTSIPVTLVLLLVVFGALIAAGIPLLLAGTAVVDGHLAAGHPQPLAAGGQHHLVDRAAGGHGRRHRLLAVLPAP